MMLSLAVRNVLRHRTRTAITLAAIVIGVVGLVLTGGFVQDLFIQLGEAIIHSQTGHVQVYRKDFLGKGSRQPEHYLINGPDKVAQRLAQLPEVSEVTSRLNFTGLLNNGKRDLGIVGEGVEPDKEAKIGTYLTIAKGRQLTSKDVNGILIGQGVAHSLALAPGDTVMLLLNTADGALNNQEFVVTGVFQSFSKDFDARAVRIPLAAAQELLVNSGANLMVVMLKKTEDTDAVLGKLPTALQGSGLEYTGWRQLSDFYDKSVNMYDSQFGVLRWIILIMVCLSVANSVNMSTYERLGEFGTMRAVGNKGTTVMKLLLTESVLLGLAGATLGCVLGILAAKVISAIGIPMPPPPNANIGYTAFIRIVPSAIGTAFLVGLFATILASIIPAYRVSRTDVVEALRKNI